MTGIQYVTDEKGRKVGVLIDLKKHGRRDKVVSVTRIAHRREVYD